MNRITAIVIIAVSLLATLSVLAVFHADAVATDASAAAIGAAIPIIIRFLAGDKESTAEKGAGPLAVLAVAGAAALLSGGCASSPPESTIVESVENAAAVAQYRLLLKPCREKGKDAGSYAVYVECADAVDREVCAKNGDRCK